MLMMLLLVICGSVTINKGPSINDVTHLGGEGGPHICDDVWRGGGCVWEMWRHIKRVTLDKTSTEIFGRLQFI